MITDRSKAAFLLLVLWGAQLGCQTTNTNTVDVIVERVRVNLERSPSLCSGSDSGEEPSSRHANGVLYIFTSDWCRACERTLDMLEAQKSALTAMGVEVRNLVTGVGRSCTDATRVAGDAPFRVGYATPGLEHRWRVRSTPTLWLIGPDGDGLLYVEGRPGPERLLEAIEASLSEI